MKTLLTFCKLLACTFFFYACSTEEEPSPNPSPAEIESLLNKNWDLHDTHLENNPDSALFYLHKVRSLAEASNKYDWLASSHYQIAYTGVRKGQIGDAAYHYLKAAEMFRQAGALSHLASAYTSVGDIYAKAEDFKTAITYFNQAKDIFLHEGTNIDKAKIFRNLAISHKELGDFPTATEMIVSAKKYAVEAEDPANLSRVYNTWGTVNLADGDFAKAREHYQLAYQSVDGLTDDLYLKAGAHNNIGEAFLFEGNYNLAEEWLNKALEIKIEINDPSFTQSTLNNLGRLRIEQGQYEEAINILEQGFNNLDLGTVDPAVEEGLALMMEALVKTNAKGTPAQYAHLNKQLATYSQKLMAYNNKLSNLKQQLETTSKQQALQLALEKHTLGNQLEAAEEKNKQIQYAFIIPVLLLIAASISVYLAIRRNRNAKRLINAIDDVLNKRHQNIAR